MLNNFNIYTEGNKDQTLVKDDMKVYHGTSKYNWENKYPDNSTLFLTSNHEDAAKCAYEVAADDEYSGLRQIPMVVSIDIENLLAKDLEFDIGSMQDIVRSESSSWEESLRHSDSFTVFGNIEDLKPLFQIEKIGIKKS